MLLIWRLAGTTVSCHPDVTGKKRNRKMLRRQQCSIGVEKNGILKRSRSQGDWRKYRKIKDYEG